MQKRVFTIIKTVIISLVIIFAVCACESGDNVKKFYKKEPTGPAVPDTVTPNRPFPQEVVFDGCIKPNDVTQQEMNDAIVEYFEAWIDQYVKGSNGVTRGGGYYVAMKGVGATEGDVTTSEAHGYGMILFALMAGAIDNAKSYFDGMYNMYNRHRSIKNENLMSWTIHSSESTSYDDDSATDGDLDIAYALILAHYQWGSDGEIDYLNEAKRMITRGIKESEISSVSKRVLLGDWDGNRWTSRPSDWMTDHFNAYYNVTGDSFWQDVNDVIYKELIPTLTANYSPKTGLLPDFIINEDPRPAKPNFLEREEDGKFYWNACRVPWRIVTDYAHYGTPEAKATCEKIVNWIKEAAPEPFDIKAGYDLDGTELNSYSSMAFVAPMVAACITNEANQQYLNYGWYEMYFTYEDYYSDTINLLCMLLISGNWWAPIE